MPYRSDFRAVRNDETAAPETTPKVTIALGGHYMHLHAPAPVVPGGPGGKRGSISGFTAGSRRRLLALLHQLNRDRVPQLPLFITLTYPPEVNPTGKASKRDLDRFCRRLLRRHPNAAIIWKLEYQKRGAVHYHLLVFGVGFIARNEVANAWYEVVGSQLEKHRTAGTRVERVASWNGVVSYAAKYLGKVGGQVEDEAPGRFWGVYGRENLPIELLVRLISWHTLYWLRRRLWRRAAGRGFATGRKGYFTGIVQFIGTTDAIALLNLALRG